MHPLDGEAYGNDEQKQLAEEVDITQFSAVIEIGVDRIIRQRNQFEHGDNGAYRYHSEQVNLYEGLPDLSCILVFEPFLNLAHRKRLQENLLYSGNDTECSDHIYTVFFILFLSVI